MATEPLSRIRAAANDNEPRGSLPPISFAQARAFASLPSYLRGGRI